MYLFDGVYGHPKLLCDFFAGLFVHLPEAKNVSVIFTDSAAHVAAGDFEQFGVGNSVQYLFILNEGSVREDRGVGFKQVKLSGACRFSFAATAFF